MSNLNNAKLLTPEETADLLKIDISTLATWRCKKRYALKFLKLGNRVRYRYNDIVEFIESKIRH